MGNRCGAERKDSAQHEAQLPHTLAVSARRPREVLPEGGVVTMAARVALRVGVPCGFTGTCAQKGLTLLKFTF